MSPMKKNIIFFPEYNNEYQELFYENVVCCNSFVKGAENIDELFSTPKIEGFENIIHLHWVNFLFDSVSPDCTEYILKRSYFLEGVAKKKEEGFKIYWTIHNYLSHDCLDPKSEVLFRKRLYLLVNKVFVHHPLAINLLDWLPNRRKVKVINHGHYRFNNISFGHSRSFLGIDNKDFVIGFVGSVRPYKDLGDYIPLLYNKIINNKNLHVIVAGNCSCDKFKKASRDFMHPRLKVFDYYLSEAEISMIMSASNIGFLSYKEVLTSGTLIKWFTEGRPVLAPNKGMIKAQVVDHWNGYTYESKEKLSLIIDKILDQEARVFEFMCINASKTAKSLVWSADL